MSDYWTLIEPAYDRVDIYGTPKHFLKGLAQEAEPVRLLLCVHWCDSEVCNGGYAQFFENATGVLAPEAVEGYRAVGRPDLAKLLDEAMKLLTKGKYPRVRKKRQKLLAAHGKAGTSFEDLEDMYYEAKDGTATLPGLYPAMDAFASKVGIEL